MGRGRTRRFAASRDKQNAATGRALAIHRRFRSPRLTTTSYQSLAPSAPVFAGVCFTTENVSNNPPGRSCNDKRIRHDSNRYGSSPYGRHHRLVLVVVDNVNFEPAVLGRGTTDMLDGVGDRGMLPHGDEV